MSVLSEATIRTHLHSGQLILGGDPGRVRGSSYSCRAIKIFPGGLAEDDRPIEIDWSTPGPAQVFRVQPRQIIWVRIRETVKLPDNVCAFWWQTNTLSRKGLMLVNMSMVDPGYEGALACLFVNFGREPVDLDSDMTPARLVFHRLDGAATPFGAGPGAPDYDRTLREVALAGPSSFLSLREFSFAFRQERDAVLKEFQEEAKSRTAALTAQMQKDVETHFKDSVDNLPKFLLKSYAIAFMGFALLVAAISFAPWVKDQLALDLDQRVSSAVQGEIGRRLQPISLVDADRAAALEQRIEELERLVAEQQSGEQ
jgi:deoxycytidine triphosphate deaminase